MFGDMELVRNAQQDAPTFRRVSLDLTQSQHQASLRRLSLSSSVSSTSSVSQASSPTFSSSVPTPHSFWPERTGLSGLFRSGSGSMPHPQTLSPIQGTPEAKVPALIRSLSKGMDAFR